MSMLVAHMKKHNSGSSCSGIYSHNERLYDSLTNKDIDKNKSFLNYELINNNHRSYNEIIKDKIKELGYGQNGKKQLRKDAVKMCSWIITSDTDFFKNLSVEEEKRFFIESLNYFKDKFGQENIISATVHKDETTPHLHLNLMPILDNKFNCKTLFNKYRLKDIQKNLPLYLQNKGFNILRGKENSTNEHLNELDFKIHKRLEKLKELDNLIELKTNLSKEIVSLALNINTEEIKRKELIENYNKTINKINNIDNSIILRLKSIINKDKKELEKEKETLTKKINEKENNKKTLSEKLKEKQKILENKEKNNNKSRDNSLVR